MSREHADHCPNQECFTVGAKVTSLVTAQGLEKGRSYTVELVASMRSFLGTFLTVAVRDGKEVHYVVNPTLLLRQD
jgi:hypothetical protein